MEDNLKVNETTLQEQDSQKKKNKFPMLILIMMLLCVTVFGVLIGTGILPVPVGNGQAVDMNTAKLLKQASDVKDELTLRELLLLDMEVDITVTEDIEIDETFIVKGTKTLYGDAMIKADIFGLFQERSVFEIQRGASMTIDGLVIDGNGMADGYTVNQGAELTYLSGTIQKVRYGIKTNGQVTVEDVLITTTGRAAVQSLFKSEVTLNGGTYKNSNFYNIYVDSASTMTINEGVVAEGTRAYSVYNNGTLRIYGGVFKNSNLYGIYNEGDLVMEYKGSKENGYIEIADTGSAGVYLKTNTDCSIKNVHTTNIGTNAILIAAVGKMAAQGDVVIEDCLFETSGQVSGNAMSICGKVDVKNIQIKDSKAGCIYVKQDGDVSIDNVTIENSGGVAMMVEGATVTAQNISVNGTQTGIYVKVKDNSKGLLNLSKITIAGSESGNLYAYEGAELHVKDAVLEESVSANVNITGAVVTLENVKALGTSKAANCLYVAENADVTLLGDTVISGGFGRGAGVVNATLTMEEGNISNNGGTEYGAGVVIIDGGTFNMLDGTINNNKTTASAGGVHVGYGCTFNMKGGTIKENEAKGGAGVVIQGVMNFSGGSINNNKSTDVGGGINVGRDAKRETYGVLNMTGGSVCNNTAESSGGGIHVSWTSCANLSGGEVTGNISEKNGNGILDNGNTTISGSFYMGDDEIALCSKAIVLKIEGNSLKKHNATKPLLVTPYLTSTTGTVVVECDNEKSAELLLNSVSSGSKAFQLCQNSNDTKTMTVFYNEADMDMTGADNVYVSNFEELKQAVESTKSKRYVVICADIEMESVVTVPSGTTVYIRDDGQTRTLSRLNGTTESFFRTYHGTGIYLAGTSEGKLILDGTHSSDADNSKIASLVQVRGTTEMRNATLKNNGSTEAEISGAFVSHIYGKLSVYNSTFNNGIASRGGSIYIGDSASIVNIEDTEFKNNSATEGGAILNYGKLEVTNCDFTNNETTVKDGGAIFNNFNSELTITDSTFISNTSVRNGGAIGNNSGATITINGSEFTSNVAKNLGGAIINHGSSNTAETVLNINNSTFTSNRTENGQGGAIYNNTGAVVDVSEGSTFEDNSAIEGGAIYTFGILCVDGSNFIGNQSTSKDGGAIFNNAEVELTIKDSAFTSNISARHGGAIANNPDAILTISGGTSFESNIAKTYGGAIINHGDGTIKINGSDTERVIFGTNSASQGNDIYDNGGKLFEISNVSFSSGKVVLNCNVEISDKVTGVTFEYKKADVSVIVGERGITNDSDVKIAAHTHGVQAVYAVEGEDVIKQAVNNGSIVGAGSSSTDKEWWTIDEEGKAYYNANVGDGYVSWTNAVKHSGGGFLYLQENVSMAEKVTIDGNVKIYGNNKTIDIGTLTGQIFTVNSEGSLELNGYENGTLILDGNAASRDASATRIVYNNGGTFTLGENAIIQNLDTTWQGGAVYNTGTAYLYGNIQYMISSNQGGAVHNASNATLNVEGSTISNNAGSQGGAINNLGTLTIKEAIFESNSGSGKGGAIYNDSNGNLTIKKSTFDSNSSSGDHGGAIYNLGTLKVEENCSFIGNSTTASKDGGAIFNKSNKENTVDNATFTSNTSARHGGAVTNDGSSTLTLIGCTFDGNSASSLGEAIMNHGSGILSIENIAFANNGDGVTDDAVCDNGGTINVSGAITGAHIVFNTNSTKVVISKTEFDAENSTLTIKPKTYATGQVVLYAEDDTDEAKEALADAAEMISVTQKTGDWWKIDSDGKLYGIATVGSSTDVATYDSLVTAMSSVQNGSTIYILEDIEVTSNVNVAENSNITIKNAPNVNATIYLTKRISIPATSEVSIYCHEDGGTLTVDARSMSYAKANPNTASTSKTARLILNSGTFTLGKGVTLQYANLTGEQGGGIYNQPGAVANIYGDLKYNAGSQGAAIYNAGTVNASGNNFVSNIASDKGGAIYNKGTANLNSNFTENKSNRGGAIYNDNNAVLVITGGIFAGNESLSNDGGAINNNSAKTSNSISGATFEKNKSARHGGAIANQDNDPYLTITNCGFDGNTCGSGRVGSAIITHKGSLFINNSWFVNHTTSVYEGITGIFRSGGTITLNNVTTVKPEEQGE